MQSAPSFAQTPTKHSFFFSSFFYFFVESYRRLTHPSPEAITFPSSLSLSVLLLRAALHPQGKVWEYTCIYIGRGIYIRCPICGRRLSIMAFQYLLWLARAKFIHSRFQRRITRRAREMRCVVNGFIRVYHLSRYVYETLFLSLGYFRFFESFLFCVCFVFYLCSFYSFQAMQQFVC